MDRNPDMLICLEGSGPFSLPENPANYQHYPQIVLGYNLDDTLRRYKATFGILPQLTALDSPSDLQAWQVVGFGEDAGGTPDDKAAQEESTENESGKVRI